ncbi:unnamed protein product [Schistosoma mattheei]|uniref:Uncharacterized protein n=1 Tax=Schistosoma mattheei TaxID=31246 RepID=A0A3P8GJ08_9TREM|nr:unnamed protein product [Schistosoma mattheei]
MDSLFHVRLYGDPVAPLSGFSSVRDDVQTRRIRIQDLQLSSLEVKRSRSIPKVLGANFASGIFADLLRINTKLSRTTIHKLFAGLGFGLKGIFFIALGYAPSEIYATMLLSLALGK